MSEATKELIWMNQQEEPEVSRDWSRVDLEDVQDYGEVWNGNWFTVNEEKTRAGIFQFSTYFPNLKLYIEMFI